MKAVATTLISLVLISAQSSGRQSGFEEDFSDGGFPHTLPWWGDTDRWDVVPFESGYALQSFGAEQQDTLTLVTESNVAYGTWEFFFRHEEVNLSNFNGVRIYLMADADDLRASLHGYYIQIGTNNLNRIELWRQNGESHQRTRIAESEQGLLSGLENEAHLRVSRSPRGEWSVEMNSSPLFSSLDNTYQNGPYFGLWIKHSASGGSSFYFDNFRVEGKPFVDVTPPEPLGAEVSNDGTEVSVIWSEPLDPATIRPNYFTIGATVNPRTATYHLSEAGAYTRLLMDPPLDPGLHIIAVTAIADTSGNVVEAGTTVDVLHDPDLSPPVVMHALAEGADAVIVKFDEVLDSASIQRTAFEITPEIGFPADVVYPTGNDDRTILLLFDSPLETSTLYRLHVRAIRDVFGNTLGHSSIPLYTGEPGSPVYRDLVVNEIFYDPPDNSLEFVEVYNRSNRVLDASDLFISDDRLIPVQVTQHQRIIAPGDYVLLARDASALATEYPGVAAITVQDMPVFRRSGDGVFIYTYGSVLDSVSYRPSWGGDKVSLERIDPDGPSHMADNWGSSVAPAAATPGTANSIYNPDVIPPSLIFADETDRFVIEAFFNKVLHESSFHVDNFRLNDRAPGKVERSPDDRKAYLIFESEINPGLLTATDIRDLPGNLSSQTSIPVARQPATGQLILNEIMYAPVTDRFDNLPDQPQYIELYNPGPWLITLRNSYWTNQPDGNHVADTTLITDDLIAVPPKGYAVVFSDPKSSDSVPEKSMLAKAFTEIDFSSEQIVPVPQRRSTLGLRRTSDVIRLHNAGHACIDSVRFDNSWHNPDLISTAGTSLERISEQSPTDDPDSWTSSVAHSGGTPGVRNSVSTGRTAAPDRPGLAVIPPVFSPTGDGIDDVAALSYTLSSPVATIRARIFDASGRLVRTLEDARLSGQNGVLIWDGRDDNRNELRIGIYVVHFEGLNTAGGIVDVFKEPVVLARPLR